MSSYYVSIWLCNFPNDDDLQTYVKEIYDAHGDVSSEFMSSFEIDFIDNQFQEVLFVPKNATKETLIGVLSYSEYFINQVTFRATDSSVIALYNFEYNGNKKQDKYCRFIGSFSYKP